MFDTLSRLKPTQQKALGIRLGKQDLGLDEGLDEFVTVGMAYLKLSQETRDAYARDLRDVVAFLKRQGHKDWNNVGLRDLQRYLADVDYRKLSTATRNRRTWAIKKLFQFLVQSQYLTSDPSAGLIPIPVIPKERRFLTEAEYKQLLDQVHESRDRAILLLYLQVGLTVSEVSKLTVDDVTLPPKISEEAEDVGFVRVKRRRGTDHLPLNWKACQALAEWLDERSVIDVDKILLTDALFVSRESNPMSRNMIGKMVRKYVKRAGLEGVSSRTLRHTMATHFIAKGGDVRATQEMLGLESIKQMQVYVKAASKVQRKMVQELAL